MTAPSGTQTRTYSLGPVLPHVRRAAELAGARFGIATILGWRATARDMTGHPAGRALDFMTSDRATGDALAEWLLANAQALGVEHVIWWQRYREPGGAWDPMADRGSRTQNHFDHVHAKFTLRAGTGEPTSGDATPEASDGAGGSWLSGAADVGVKLVVTAGALALLVAGASHAVRPGRTP